MNCMYVLVTMPGPPMNPAATGGQTSGWQGPCMATVHFCKWTHQGMESASLRGRGIWSQLRNPSVRSAKLFTILFHGGSLVSAFDGQVVKMVMAAMECGQARLPKSCNRLVPWPLTSVDQTRRP